MKIGPFALICTPRGAQGFERNRPIEILVFLDSRSIVYRNFSRNGRGAVDEGRPELVNNKGPIASNRGPQGYLYRKNADDEGGRRDTATGPLRCSVVPPASRLFVVLWSPAVSSGAEIARPYGTWWG